MPLSPRCADEHSYWLSNTSGSSTALVARADTHFVEDMSEAFADVTATYTASDTSIAEASRDCWVFMPFGGQSGHAAAEWLDVKGHIIFLYELLQVLEPSLS